MIKKGRARYYPFDPTDEAVMNEEEIVVIMELH